MWEESITAALEEGFFRAEEYSASFYLEAEHIATFEVFSVSCFGGWIQFTVAVQDVGGVFDAVRIYREGLPELMKEVEKQPLKSGNNINIRFTRPIKE